MVILFVWPCCGLEADLVFWFCPAGVCSPPGYRFHHVIVRPWSLGHSPLLRLLETEEWTKVDPLVCSSRYVCSFIQRLLLQAWLTTVMEKIPGQRGPWNYCLLFFSSEKVHWNSRSCFTLQPVVFHLTFRHCFLHFNPIQVKMRLELSNLVFSEHGTIMAS